MTPPTGGGRSVVTLEYRQTADWYGTDPESRFPSILLAGGDFRSVPIKQARIIRSASRHYHFSSGFRKSTTWNRA
jgi:hypothetical protein